MRTEQADVQRGKRGDPTKSENYEDAPGYNSSYGDKGQWKQQYRQGYMAGYQRAIYGERRGWDVQEPVVPARHVPRENAGNGVAPRGRREKIPSERASFWAGTGRGPRRDESS